MFADMLLFMYLAYRYKSVPITAESESDQTEQEILNDDKTKDNNDLLEGFDNNAFKKD